MTKIFICPIKDIREIEFRIKDEIIAYSTNGPIPYPYMSLLTSHYKINYDIEYIKSFCFKCKDILVYKVTVKNDDGTYDKYIFHFEII